MKRSVLLILLVLALTACGRSRATSTPEPAAAAPTTAPTEAPAEAAPTEVPATEEPAAEQPAASTLEASLGNLTYQVPSSPSGTVTLTDGEFSEPAAPGSATMTKVTLTEYMTTGQIDGQDAVAVVLVTDPGGSGTFYDLALVVDQDGEPVNVASTMLGDRVQINSIEIVDDAIVIDMVEAGPDDPMCCPTQHVIKTFALQDGELVETSSEIVEDEASTTPEPDADTSVEAALGNLTYQVPSSPNLTVTLTDVEFSEPAAPGSATFTQVMLTEYIATGQIDGQDAAAVILVTDPGGSGTFYDLALVVDQDGELVNVASTVLGDRVQINSVEIVDNAIVLDMIQVGPDDPMCCPSQHVIKTFALQDGELVETSAEIVEEEAASESPEGTATPQPEPEASPLDSMEHVADPNLIDKTWYWDRRDPNGNDIPPITVAEPDQYTLQFGEDGTLAATLDCNQAAGRYATNPEQGSIFMELGPMTMAFCGEESLDMQMMVMFGPVQDYRLEEEGTVLVLPWVAAGPIDYFRTASEVDLPAPEAGVATGTVTAPNGVFLRTGPGTAYETVGVAALGDSGEIIGVSEDGLWWLANAPNLAEDGVWVAAEWVEATNTDDVPVVPAPPLPAAPAMENEDADDAVLADGEPYEVSQDVILYSASRTVQEGNRTSEFDDVYAVQAVPDSTPEMVANNAAQPALSPDRQTLAFHSTQSDKLGLGGYDLSTGERLRFSAFHEDSNPRWSPAGDMLVFASNKEGDRAWRIYLTAAAAQADPANMSAQELGFGKDPDWHPSEELLVFKGCDDQGQNCGLYTMGLDGSGRTQLTDDASDSMPRWLPDGSGVIFMSEGRDGNWELYHVTIPEGIVTRLTDDPAPDGLPAVRPDGQQIAFISQRGETWGLWVLAEAGDEPSLITPIAGDQPNWLTHSVDWPQ